MKKPTQAQIIQGRKLWLPQRKEVKEQCVSCPFKTGNDAEFGEILRKLIVANGGGRITKAIIQRARMQIMLDLQRSGDFVCHLSVYEPDVDGKRPQGQWRQCKGASEFYREAKGVK